MQLKIEKLVYGGAGVGFLDKMPVFVPMTIPCDEIECKITHRFKGYAEGRLIKILKPSPNRVVPKCEYFGRCGGCQWQHMDYAAQILWKQIIVEEQLRRIGKISEPNVLPTVPSPKIWNYRSRIKLHKDKNGRLGFYAQGTHELIAIEKCLIADEIIPPNPPLKKGGIISTSSPFSKGGLRGITTGMEGFTQVNPKQNENLKSLVVAMVMETKAKEVLELYCGNGNLTFPLAEVAGGITAADCDKKAVSYAEKIANKNKITNVHFICHLAPAAINYFARNRKGVDCLVLDPPRDGCNEILDGIVRLKPKSIVYVSCNPSTLARDVRILIDGGYSLKSAQPIDMFPQTFHIEVVAVLE